MSTPVAIVLSVEIAPAALADFEKLIAGDASATRSEAGCLRFDVLRDQTANNKFVFYEIFQNEAAFEAHKATEHFKAMEAYNKSGAVVGYSLVKGDAINYA